MNFMNLMRGLSPAAVLAAAGCMGNVPLPQRPALPSAAATLVRAPEAQSTIRQAQYVEARPPAPAAQRPQVIALPQAIHECMYSNLRIQAKGEKVYQAMADLRTDSLIPNMQLFADYQLVPLQNTDINHQAGPPQWDLLVTMPVDWLLFGKRVAAIEASRLNVDVAQFDLADFARLRVADTVAAFYELLAAQELFRLAKEEVADLTRIEGIIRKQAAAGGAPAIDADRARLAVLDATREAHHAELAVAVAKAKLRPLLGRSAADPDFTITGTLTIAQPAKPPALADVLALAEQNRPDLHSDRRSVDQAWAALRRERRKAKPTVSVQSGLSAQVQQRITGFPDAVLYDVGLTTSLPFTDRNQGGILKAESQIRESALALQADLHDARAEVERALEEYRDAYEHAITDDAESLKTAKDILEKMEAAYRAGSRKLLEVLDAQRAYRERVKITVMNQSEYWQALNKLNAAVGVPVGEGKEGK